MSEIRQTIRCILQKPAFAVTAILTIALGIGANTAVYAVIHAVLIAPLPFRNPHALVQVWETHPDLHNLQVAVPDYLDWKRYVKSVDIEAYTFPAMNKGTLTGQGDPAAVQCTNASADLFPLLGIKPLLGHLYGANEERAKQNVAVISEQLWRQKFSADPGVIGRALRIDTTAFTIVGVLRQTNAFPTWADIWIPFSRIEPDLASTRKYHPLEVVGRLRPGATLRQAEIEIENTARQLSASYPATNGKIGAFAVPLLESITGEVRPALLAAWIAVGLVLLIACTNLAHLMMGRALNRRHEISIRLALGAGRFAAFRAFLLEATALSLAGGALGILAAFTASPVIQNLAKGQIPRFDGAQVNLSVLLFGTLACFLVAVIFALPSYLQISRSDLNDAISSGNTRVSSLGGSRVSLLLMTSEVALSVSVLLAAILLVRSFSLTLLTQPGFLVSNLLAVHSPLADRDWQKSYSLFCGRIAPELQSVPGVQEVAAINALPMTLGTTEHSRFATRFGIVGREFGPGRFPTAQTRWGTANYLQVLGVPLIHGRFLTDQDHNQPRTLVNQTFARRFFPHSDPVGQKILLGVVTPHPDSVEVVGVVGDIHEFGLTSPPEPTMYSVDVSPEMDVIVKTSRNDAALISLIAATMRNANPQEAIGPVRELKDYIAASLARQRFILALIATFAGLAVFLCAIGIYGVFSYSVNRRKREFGIRAAVGARGADLLAQVLRECLAVVVPGALAGLGLAAACAQFMRTLLYQVSPTDPLASGVTLLSILGLCLGCVIIPALRAAKADPAIILREQ
ncbi:MAG TPA: ABC transporter permease [Bryobacteraceae bacterium]|jgi:predicted permease|nr:ABC transporter permease [Bryobacteraceae bacterium]